MFKLIHTGAGDMPATLYLPAGAITPKIGMGLALNSSGQLAASAKPQYISLFEGGAALAAGTTIPVIKIEQDMVFESALDGATTLKAGTLADVASGGLLIDGDGTTNKVFLIEWLEGSAQGNKVRGRFVRSDGEDNVDATAAT